MNPKKFIVTGGNGYIGSHMCRFLFEKGHEVHIVDNHSSSPSSTVHSFGEFYSFDITAKTKMYQLLAEVQPDGIFHFAAKALVGESEENPFLYYQKNYVDTISFLETCQKANSKNIIFSSTCSIFEGGSEKFISETDPKKPQNTYGLTKLLIEKTLEDLSRHEILNSVSLRYFNVAGCSEDGLLGENHQPETHLIPNLIKSIISPSDFEFTLFGEDYKTKDGTNIRDYIHVVDLVRAHYLAWEYLLKNSGCHQFNLGSGVGYSNLDVLKAVEKVCGAKVKYQKGPRRDGDPAFLVADHSLAQKVLGFTPEYNLEDCLTHAYQYFSNHLGIKKAS